MKEELQNNRFLLREIAQCTALTEGQRTFLRRLSDEQSTPPEALPPESVEGMRLELQRIAAVVGRGDADWFDLHKYCAPVSPQRFPEEQK